MEQDKSAWQTDPSRTSSSLQMERDDSAYETLRDPSTLMKPERLGTLKQTPLSFARLLVRRMVNEQWEIDLYDADLDKEGNGRARYRISTPSRDFWFPIYSQKISEEEKTDRITADTWDMWGFLCEGEPDEEFIDWQFDELPHVREGRATSDVLIWTRANRSSRFFDHVVDSLTAGHQPDIDFLSEGGYLIRSSGYYGNGFNGTKVYEAIGSDHPLNGPYMAQMLSAYMWRLFGYDLADAIASERNSDAATLDHDIKRYLGTGNSSGMGVAFFAINHPKLIHTWLRAREIALARVKTIGPSDADLKQLDTLLRKAEVWFAEDESDSKGFFLSKSKIATELREIRERINVAAQIESWAVICDWTEENTEAEVQEVFFSLLMDLYPDICRELEDTLNTTEKSDLVPEMSTSKLRSLLNTQYQWALDIDMTEPGANRNFWYRSVNGEEPRIGKKGESGAEGYSLPIEIVCQVQQLAEDLTDIDSSDTVAEFLFDHPEHRYMVERIQTVHTLEYAEVRGNLSDAEFVPLHLVSLLKSFWGIQKTHPANKGWVKGTFFQGAPLPDDIRQGESSYWLYPPRPEQTAHWRDQA